MREATQTIFSKLKEVLAGGVNSPVRSGTSVKQLPMVVDHATDDTLVDVDGERFIDFCCSWGAIILGHGDRQVLKKVHERALKGTSFGISCPSEEKLAREIARVMPSIERIRFVSSGTEAAMSAARVARGFTGKDLIVKFSGHYHGHADLFLVQAGSGVLSLNSRASSKGVPEAAVQHTASLTFNELDACRAFLREASDSVAAVILEPIAGNMGVVPAENNFLQMLREETERSGALLIFDEVMTGFRVALGGAQELYGITPDLTCLGKVIGGGFPVAAFGGKAEVMQCLAPQGEVYQAGTLSGNPVAMEAGYQTLLRLQEPGTYETLQRKSESITKPVQEAIDRLGMDACVQQAGSMFTIFFGKKAVRNSDDAKGLDLERFARFFQYCFRSGIYPPPSQHEAWFMTLSHSEKNLETTREVIIECLERFACGG